MKRILVLLTSLFIGSMAWGRQAMTPAPLNVRTVDGTVTNYPYQLKFPNGDLTDNADGTMTVADSTTSLAATAIIRTSTLQSGATFFVSSGTAVSFNSSSATITHILGTTTNDNATVGSYGEYISSSVAAQAVGTTAQYSDVCSISLTAGDWDVTGMVDVERNGGTFSAVTLFAGISTTSGNSGTGLVTGNTLSGIGLGAANLTFSGITQTIPAVRMSLSATTTVYLKGYVDAYSAGTPQHYGRISARRVR